MYNCIAIEVGFLFKRKP